MIASPVRNRLLVVATGVAVAIVAGVVSVGRLLLSDASALSTLVWAEDGLFPLCARAHGAVACAVEPYAGYLLLLPRLIAWPVSLVPLDAWPAATNFAAAIVAAAAAGAIVYVLRASGSGWACTVVIALLPVAAPIMGVEAINSSANSYLLLPFVACLALCLPPQRGLPTWWYAAGALLCALTIPSSVVLFLPLAVQAWRGRITRRDATVLGGALAIGLALQAVAVLSSGTSRGSGVGWSGVRSFVDAVPTVLLTNWPFYDWRIESGAFVPVSLAAYGLGALVVALATVAGVVLVLRTGYASNAVGLLLVCGPLFAAIPVVFLDSANNRYYVLLVLLWTAAGFVALDRWLPRRLHAVAMAAVAAVVALLWIPSLPASEFRADARPDWATSMIKVKLACLENPSGAAAVRFTPNWPATPNNLAGLTTNVVPCSALEGL